MTEKTSGPGGDYSYYASRSELLEWTNGLLQLELTKLEQFANGSVFCQLVDAYFPDAVAVRKINYSAKDEYDSLSNYKLLQVAFTNVNITREVDVTKLTKASQAQNLELLQYMYKYLIKFSAREGYDAKKQRMKSLRGATHNIPVPDYMQSDFDKFGGNKGGPNLPQGTWGYINSPRGGRSGGSTPTAGTPRASGSSNRPSTARSSTGGVNSPRRAPQQPGGNRGSQVSSRRETVAMDDPSYFSVGNGSGDIEEEEPINLQQLRLDQHGMTRLVLLESEMEAHQRRPLSPGGRAQLVAALEAVRQAVEALTKTLVCYGQLAPTFGNSTDNFAYRGRLRSLHDAVLTLLPHTALLLGDIRTLCGRAIEPELEQRSAYINKEEIQELHDRLADLDTQLHEAVAFTEATAAATPAETCMNLQLTQLQKQLTGTTSLDCALKSVGTAQAALVQRLHRESASIAANFLAVRDAPEAGGPAPASRVLKLGDAQMKRLKNGDVYMGKYAAGRKNGDGSYQFVNADVYEGEFREDRMEGLGSYTFAPEGRYDGQWRGALYEGAGAETFSKGSTYHGQYASGLRAGWGACRFFNGDYYEGHWAQGVRDGKGMQQCTDDSNYVGEYRGGKRAGYGVYSFPNGDCYLGEYEDDIPHGYGTYVFASGQKYAGHWLSGKKHGWSVYTVETGQRWAGNWVDGKPAWVHPLAADATAANCTGQDDSPEVQDNLRLAWAACGNATSACATAMERAKQHWAPDGPVQQQLQQAMEQAATAGAGAQAARRRAQELSMKLEAAAGMVQHEARSTEITVVES